MDYDRAAISSHIDGFVDYVDNLVVSGQVPQPSEYERYYVVIIGGSACIYENVTVRDTSGDIDVFSYYLPPSVLSALYLFLMNTRSMTYGYAMPYNYEDRVEELVGSDCCSVYRASWEDIVFAKLQRNDARDFADLNSLAYRGALDWSQLHYLVTDPEEALGSGMPRHRYHELLLAYNSLLNQFGQPTLSNRQISTLLDNTDK